MGKNSKPNMTVIVKDVRKEVPIAQSPWRRKLDNT